MVEVRSAGRVVRRELTIGGGHVGGQLGWVHFGLGTATSAEVRVTWPDRQATDWQPVEANRFYVLRRGEAPDAWPGAAE